MNQFRIGSVLNNFIRIMYRGGNYRTPKLPDQFKYNIVIGDPYTNCFLFILEQLWDLIVCLNNKGKWTGKISFQKFENIIIPVLLYIPRAGSYHEK